MRLLGACASDPTPSKVLAQWLHAQAAAEHGAVPGWRVYSRSVKLQLASGPPFLRGLSREQLGFFRVAGSNLDRGRCCRSGLLLSVVPAVGCVCGWGHVTVQGRLAGRPPFSGTHTEPSTLTLLEGL